MRRLEAMAPYRDGLRETRAWIMREPSAALATNQMALGSMRFMLEAAGIESEGGVGALKLQGLAMAWARVLEVWFDDEPDLSRTMAELDRALTRGERLVGRVESVDRFAGPLKALAKVALDAGGRLRLLAICITARPRSSARRGGSGTRRRRR